MEYDQAIVLFPIVDYTKQKKNWKRIKDAIAYCSWFSQPKKVVWKFCSSGTLHIFISSTHKKKIQISFQRSCVADGIKDHIRHSQEGVKGVDFCFDVWKQLGFCPGQPDYPPWSTNETTKALLPTAKRIFALNLARFVFLFRIFHCLKILFGNFYEITISGDAGLKRN